MRAILLIGAMALSGQAMANDGDWVDSTCTNATAKKLVWDATAKKAVCADDQTGGEGGIPAGLILLTMAASCPSGFSEVQSLSGKFVLGTVVTAGDVGVTGGADTVTPTFTGTPFSQVVNHTHAVTVTDPGHAHTQAAHTHTMPVGATDDTSAPFDRADAGTNTSGANATTPSGSATPVINSATTGVTAVTANPAGGVASITPAGTISQIDNRPSFVKAIFCEKD